MLKAIKIRIYPTAEQVDFINKQLGCCRFVYNNCLAFRKDSYQNEHVSVSSSSAVKHITSLKKDNGAYEPKKLKREKVKEVLLSFRKHLSKAGSECVQMELNTFEYV